MTYVWQRWMADAYRAAGLPVIEIEGWENRGRPASTGAFNPQGPETVHHTGSRATMAAPRPSLQTLITGRPDLPGPLCQKATAYDGTVIVIAAGRANHAGRIGKGGVPGMVLGGDGNAVALGNEVMTDGTQTLPEAQLRSIAVQAAVDLRHFGVGPEYAHRHADISGTGKWDIGQLTTTQLRALVRSAMEEDDMALSQEDKEWIAAQIAASADQAATKAAEAIFNFRPIAKEDVTVRQLLRVLIKEMNEQ